MRNLLLSFSLLLILVLPTYGQSIQPEWKILRKSSQSNGNGEAWGLDSAPNGQILWSTNLTGSGWNAGLDVFTYKLQQDSTEVWSQPSHFYAQNNQQAYITVATDSVVYAGGRYCDGIGIETCDMMLMTIDNVTGDTQWVKTWDQDTLYEEVDGLVPQQDGIYLTGWTETDSTDLDLFLMKTDHNGNIQWWNTWGSNKVDHQDGHIVMTDSTIYVCGVYKGDKSSNPSFRGLNGRSLLAAFSTSNGDLMDSTTFGRNDSWYNFENALGMTSDGNHLYVTGTTTPSQNNHQIFAAKFDKNLNQIWHRTWGGDSTESARTIRVHNGTVLVVGSSNSPQYSTGGKYDAVVVSWDMNGNYLGYGSIGDSKDQDAREALILNNALYITGAEGKLSFPADKDAYLAKISLDSLPLFNNPHHQVKEGKKIHLYPDPVKGRLTLAFQSKHQEEMQIRIFDIRGEQVRQTKKQPSGYGVQRRMDLNVSSLKPGIYFLEIQGTRKNSVRKTRFIKIQ